MLESGVLERDLRSSYRDSCNFTVASGSDSSVVASFPPTYVRTHTAIIARPVQTSCMHAQVGQCVPGTATGQARIRRQPGPFRQSKSRKYGQRF